MKCTYCDCLLEGIKKLNGWDYCAIHFEKLSKVPIVDKVKGHESKYNIEQDVDFDVIDEINLSKGRRYNPNEWERNGL